MMLIILPHELGSYKGIMMSFVWGSIISGLDPDPGQIKPRSPGNQELGKTCTRDVCALAKGKLADFFFTDIQLSDTMQ